MSDWEVIAGGTLLIPTGNESHLHIILTNPSNFESYKPNQCISVNITSVKSTPYDVTCVLKAGCHPFIKQDSYVAYRHTRIDPESHLKELVEAGYFIPKDPIGSELLEVIKKGLKDSAHTPRYLKNLIN